MTNLPFKYQRLAIRTVLVWLLLIAYSRSFGQSGEQINTDSVSLREDSSFSADSAADNNFLGDSAKKTHYNYYDLRGDWPNDQYEVRKVPDTVSSRFRGADDFWYANKDFTPKADQPDQNRGKGILEWLSGKSWYRALAWMIFVGGFIAILIWFLAGTHAGIFRRKGARTGKEDSPVISENIFEIDFSREMERALQVENYRLTTRLMFLQTLRRLSERQLIQYKQSKTNFDYLAELANTDHYAGFRRLVRNYEYTWYGEFEIGQGIFAVIKSDFEKFDQLLN